jgi:protein gp37
LSGNGRVGVDWIIVGGASGPDYQNQVMDLTWLADTVKQCRDAHVPLFVKQDSGRNPGQQGRIPDDLWVRQLPRIIGAEQG